jgi:hypothetical protein
MTEGDRVWACADRITLLGPERSRSSSDCFHEVVLMKAQKRRNSGTMRAPNIYLPVFTCQQHTGPTR